MIEFDVTQRLDDEGTNVVVVKDGAPRADTQYVRVDFSDNPSPPPIGRTRRRRSTRSRGT